MNVVNFFFIELINNSVLFLKKIKLILLLFSISQVQKVQKTKLANVQGDDF